MPETSGDLELRHLGEAELADFAELEGLVWGWPAHESRAAFYREFLAPEYSRGVFHHGRLVATHGMTRLSLTVPGGQVIGAAGTTILAIHPAYRGRGLMTLLTRDAFALARWSGREPVATGVPHHSRTHLRYGFGIAARHATVRLALDGPRTLDGVSADGRIEYLTDHKEALAALHDVATALSGVRNGWIPRSPVADAYLYAAAGLAEAEYGPMALVVHRSPAGAVDGFLSYRRTSAADDYGRPSGALKVVELLGVTAAAEAQLWLHCLADPVVTRLSATRRPVADPVAARLPDPRAWQQTVRDDMILYLLDVPAALAARRYGREDRIRLAVADPDGSTGRYELSGGLAAAVCEPTSGSPDLTLTASALATAYLGDVAVADLAARGEVSEHTPGAVRRMTAMFAWAPAPWIQDTF